MVQLVWRDSCIADRLPVVVRLSADPRASLKTVDPPKGNGLGPKKVLGRKSRHVSNVGWLYGKHLLVVSGGGPIYTHNFFSNNLMDLGYLGSRNYWYFYTMQPTNPNAVT